MFNKLLDPEGSALPRLAQLGSQIRIEVNRLAALPIAELAAEIMINAFSPEFQPGAGVVSASEIADYFLPEYGAPRAGDITSAEEYELHELIAEGVQVLEHARLVRPALGHGGWATTRLGRSALAAGNVEGAISG